MAGCAGMEEPIGLGTCRAGSSTEVDEVIRLHAPPEQFGAGLEQGYQDLAQIMAGMETES